jgi:dipeptidyl aminopeptidase/acylaminoacyl peptidase
MSTGAEHKRERPRSFAEDWSIAGTARPPTTFANPLGHLEVAAEPLTEEEVAAARGVDRGGGIDLSPDGHEVAFAWDRDGAVEIYTAPLAGDRIIQLTDADARSVAPRWSPDGRWLAFARGDADRASLYVVDRDGEHEHEVTASEALAERVRLVDGIPQWSTDPAESVLAKASIDHVRGSARTSPDGAMITFARIVDGRSRIAFAHVRDGAVTRIEVVGGGTPFDDSDPVWRPDGRGVLYRHREKGNVSVRRVFTTSHADEAVLDAPGWSFSPRVAPDSETVVAILVDRQGSDVVVRPKGAVEIQPLTRRNRAENALTRP